MKKMPRKSVKCLQNRKKSLPLQPHLRTSQTATRMQGSEKVLKKVPKRFGGLKNLFYLCTRFRLKTKAGF